jgi:hypothetical protein
MTCDIFKFLKSNFLVLEKFQYILFLNSSFDGGLFFFFFF